VAGSSAGASKGAWNPHAAGLPFLATRRNEQVRVTPLENRLYEPAHTAGGFLRRPLFAGPRRNGGRLPGVSNAADASAKIYSEMAGIRSEGEPAHIGTGLGGVGAVIRLLMTNGRHEHAYVDPTVVDRGNRYRFGLAVAVLEQGGIAGSQEQRKPSAAGVVQSAGAA